MTARARWLERGMGGVPETLGCDHVSAPSVVSRSHTSLNCCSWLGLGLGLGLGFGLDVVELLLLLGFGFGFGFGFRFGLGLRLRLRLRFWLWVRFGLG